MTTPIETIEIARAGWSQTVRRCGQGPLVLCLHGFPDSAHTWDDLLPALAGAGYHAAAPFMRGYAPSGVPADGRYDAAALAGDVIALADELAPGERFYVVGHDWGAVSAYAAASAAPARLAAMVTAAVPPTGRFLASMGPAQMRRSWYMGFFQLRGVAEAAVAARDMALIDRLWRDWSPGWAYSRADIAPVKEALARPENRRAALAYYRTLPPLVFNRRARRRVMAWRTAVPTRIVYGEDDGCIGPASFKDCEQCFNGPIDCQALSAGHFMHREDPAAFTRLVLDWFAVHRA
ncbi:alpha/beta hydrolase [uncultured Salinisphaera sp.]|uniref:alpha/beta fold hydrolase n=1 Tax=uncultured Salinisphaera sp. TaxID=359372 RepID=UPI0032B27704|tara:strand:- start:1936 stop:2811 length:876 start_codon:yes stop_codon:yes gene_type:complete